MQLTQGEKIAFITAFGAVILTALIHIGIREWYAADIRYEEGSYYISGSMALASLKLKNFGHADAEDIILTAKFKKNITDISLDDQSISLINISGGKGQPSFSGKLVRLVPGQEAIIYFAIDNSSSLTEDLSKHFLYQLSFKGGIGKVGRPIWNSLFIVIFEFIFLALSMFIFNKYFEGKVRNQHYVKIDEVIDLASAARSEGLAAEVFEERLNKAIKGVTFRKKTLHKIAHKVFSAKR